MLKESAAVMEMIENASPSLQHAMLLYCDKMGFSLHMAGKFPELGIAEEFSCAHSMTYRTAPECFCVSADVHRRNWNLIRVHYALRLTQAHLEAKPERKPALEAVHSWRQRTQGLSYLHGPTDVHMEAYTQLVPSLSEEQLELFEGVLHIEWEVEQAGSTRQLAETAAGKPNNVNTWVVSCDDKTCFC